MKSLLARLMAMILIAVCTVWVVAVALTLSDAHHELDEVLDDNLAQIGTLLVSRSEYDGKSYGYIDAATVRKYAPKIRFQIFLNGSLTGTSPEIGVKPMSTISNGFDTVLLEKNEEWRVFAIRDASNGIQVYVAEMSEARNYVFKEAWPNMVFPFIAGLPILLALIWLVVWRGLQPLRSLSESLNLRKPQALFAISLNDSVPSEIKPIVQALNSLFERIEQMLVSERRFTADAAHELRTPIAAIRMQAQVAFGAGTNETERNHALRATLVGCDRATRLVEQLLTLARLEAGSEDLSKLTTNVDLSAVCRSVIAELANEALRNRQVLELVAPSKCMIVGEDLLLGVLVRNLVDNALRYSKSGSRVVVYVEQDCERPILRIEDSGEGMTEAEIMRLGERFFRVLGHEQSGSGLGWSIVKRICKVFDATLQIRRSDKLGGLSVTVSWKVSVQ
jgi:two-component system, OmpR family, sensor histidine kinase QseC